MKEEFEFPMIPEEKSKIISRRLIQGVGINDAWYKTQIKSLKCPYYSRWKGMLERGYSNKFKEGQPTYRYVTVCKEWKTFSNFRSWMEKQDWKGKQLDKDIIIPNNKVYSPETCSFVTAEVNSLLLNGKSSRGKYKQGVHYCKVTGIFKAQCWTNKGRQNYLGRFPTEQLAYEAYVTYKHALILKVASEQEDKRVKNGLLLHADILLKTLDEE